MPTDSNIRTESPAQNLRGFIAVLLAFILALGTPMTAVADPVFSSNAEREEFGEHTKESPAPAQPHDGVYGTGTVEVSPRFRIEIIAEGARNGDITSESSEAEIESYVNDYARLHSVENYDWENLENTPFDENSGWARYLPEADPDNPYEDLAGLCQNAQVAFTALSAAGGAVPSPYAKGGSLVSAGIAAGFGFFSDWALEQDLVNAAAYGADYLLTDYLIKLYGDGKATWCFYDQSAEYTIMKRADKPPLSIEDMAFLGEPPDYEHYPDANPYWPYSSFQDEKNHRETEIRSFKPWAQGKCSDFVVPDRAFKARVELQNADWFVRLCEETLPYDWDIAAATHYEDNSTYGSLVTDGKGQYYLDPDPNDGAPAADPEATNTVCRYGYQIKDDVPFTYEQLSAIQALIYHYCSAQDWRMMLAEAKRRGVELNEADFERSIQYAMGFRLTDDWKTSIGFLLLDGLSLVNGQPYLSDGHRIAYKEELSEGLLNMPWEEIAEYSAGLLWEDDPDGAAAQLTEWLASKGYEYVVAEGTAQLIVDTMRSKEEYDASVIEGMEASVGAMWDVADIAVDEANYLHQRLVQASNREKYGADIHDAYVKRS